MSGLTAIKYQQMRSVWKGHIQFSLVTIPIQVFNAVETKNNSTSILKVYAINGQLLFEKSFTNNLQFNLDYNGLILINVLNDNSVLSKKCISF